MTFDLYVWKSPRDLDADQAEALVESWHQAGANPAQGPFEPSTDVGWFYRELTKDAPGLDSLSDSVPNPSTAPIWLATTDEAPARMAAIRLGPDTSRDVLELILGLATKYDLVLFDRRNRRVHLPLEAIAAYASRTFWPAGAIQAAVAGAIGAVIAVVGWILGIPVVNWLLVLVGGFMVVMSIYTFVHEGRKALKARRSPGEP